VTVQESAFIGSGWAFPIRPSSTGGITTVTGEEDIRRAIHLILGTTPGERPMRPEFGCPLIEFVYAPMNSGTFGAIAFEVEQALRRWEPRIELEDVLVYPYPGVDACLAISVTYHLRHTFDRRNLVFPFYVIPDHPE
jgi:phage baseplate assembly protein W